MTTTKPTPPVTRAAVLRAARRWFGGKPYVTSPAGRHFLVLARPKVADNWIVNGKPHRFTYMETKVVASGWTWKALMASLRHYHGLAKAKEGGKPR